jgi:thiosulfate dehydrogenase
MKNTLHPLFFLQLVLILVYSCNDRSAKSSDHESRTGVSLNAETYHFPASARAEKFDIKNLQQNLPDSLDAALINYGYELMVNTSRIVGPHVADTAMRYAGNNLACVNCHLSGGTKTYSASWVGVMTRYPKYRNKNGKVNDMEMRVNGCFQRSMNGRPLPRDSREMRAIIAYYSWLSSDTSLNSKPEYKGYVDYKSPHRAADTTQGRRLFMQHCYVCHGSYGEGLLFDRADTSRGYIYPQLWGNDTYNIGAGMAKMETFAAFVKGNMPYGVLGEKPHLTDAEAYDIAGYVNMQQRPVPPGLDGDFPDRSTKGADVPYGPYIDPYPPLQHRIGPLQPIKAWYKELKKDKPDDTSGHEL